MGEAGASRSDYTPSEDDNVLVQGITGDRNALGYFGYAYYAVNTDKVKAIGVDGGNGCVLPTVETIRSGEYTPLSRPVFIYVNTESLERPEVQAFIEFYMQEGGALAEEVGYVALPDEVYEQNLALAQSESEAPPASGELSGSIQVDGSSTVYPITQAVAEEFRFAGNPDVHVTVGVSGTGGGFRRFVNGETDISNASRVMSESERQTAEANGVEFIELRVALDGLSVMVNPRNDFVECLTVEELRRIWEPGSDIETWSQVRESFPE
jgi:ABC-type phosphate transport system substrate-binding protein